MTHAHLLAALPMRACGPPQEKERLLQQLTLAVLAEQRKQEEVEEHLRHKAAHGASPNYYDLPPAGSSSYDDTTPTPPAQPQPQRW